MRSPFWKRLKNPPLPLRPRSLERDLFCDELEPEELLRFLLKMPPERDGEGGGEDREDEDELRPKSRDPPLDESDCFVRLLSVSFLKKGIWMWREVSVS
jgi:hypothetical protein